MQRWLAYRARVDLRVGGSHELWLGGSDSEAPVQHGTITELEIGSVIQVDYDDGSTLRWEVHPDGNGARLVFTDARPLVNVPGTPYSPAGTYASSIFPEP